MTLNCGITTSSLNCRDDRDEPQKRLNCTFQSQICSVQNIRKNLGPVGIWEHAAVSSLLQGRCFDVEGSVFFLLHISYYFPYRLAILTRKCLLFYTCLESLWKFQELGQGGLKPIFPKSRLQCHKSVANTQQKVWPESGKICKQPQRWNSNEPQPPKLIF